MSWGRTSPIRKALEFADFEATAKKARARETLSIRPRIETHTELMMSAYWPTAGWRSSEKSRRWT